MEEENPVEDWPPADDNDGQDRPILNSIIEMRRLILITSLCYLIGLSHYYYTSTIFENERNFSHLSDLEREMSLRTELGFYYSYYKTLAQEYPFGQGLTRLTYDKLAEHPNTINSFNRFNIHPEVILAALYRYFEPWLNTTAHVQCFTVQRPQQPPVQSCTGIGVPIMFYLEGVWVMAGVTLVAVFLHAFVLGDTILGGCVAVLQYYANHKDATRVQWAPNERENFAWPLLLLQSMLVCLQLKDKERRMTFPLQLGIFFLNSLCLLFWQFSQFVFLAQICIFFLMEQMYIIDIKTLCVFLHAHFCGLHMAVLLLQGNDMLKSSLYTCMFIAVCGYCLCFCNLRVKIVKTVHVFMEAWLVILRISTVTFGALFLRKWIAEFLEVDEDSHVWDLFFAKFFDSFVGFHTLLYSCSATYAFLPAETIKSLTYSGLLPTAAVGAYLAVREWVRNGLRAARGKEEPPADDDDSGIENSAPAQAPAASVRRLRGARVCPARCYALAQLGVFALMALLVMRLKLLLVSQLCVVSALAFQRGFYASPRGQPQYRKYVLWLALSLPLAYALFTNVPEELSVMGEYSDPPLERLLLWIRNNTEPKLAFAGSMPLMATVMLATRRPVVVHPHYEHYEVRMRAYGVYKVYGRFTAQELYKDLTKVKTSYLIVEWNLCYGKSKTSCTYQEIWERAQPARRRAPLCRALRAARLDHFYPVYDSAAYSVYRLHDLGLRYMPRSFDT